MAKTKTKELPPAKEVRLARESGIQPLPQTFQKTNLELSSSAVEALGRLKQQHGVGRTFAIERSVLMLENHLNGRSGK